jgi:hypothetical protein
MTATLTLADPATERVARLPLSALFSQGEGPSLYVADGKTGAVSLKPVTVKAYETKDVIITGGVEEGASVVVLGAKARSGPEGPHRFVIVVLTQRLSPADIRGSDEAIQSFRLGRGASDADFVLHRDARHRGVLFL